MTPDNPPSFDERDPLNLESIDRDIRINELTEQLNERGMQMSHFGEECPAEVQETFLENILAYESAPVDSCFARLEKGGVSLPPPASLEEGAINAKLMEIFQYLAARSIYFSHTDHLSDRELYERLWADTLREQYAMMPPGSGWVCHIDLISSGSDEDNFNALRYYDSEERRARWATDFPGDVIPDHEDPPFDRDRHLPQVPQDWLMGADSDPIDDEPAP